MVSCLCDVKKTEGVMSVLSDVKKTEGVMSVLCDVKKTDGVMSVLCDVKEENDELHCRVCKMYFSSLHNKKEHLLGKQHLQAITGQPPALFLHLFL